MNLLPELLTIIVQARQSRGADQERHLARAERMCRAMLGERASAAVCIHDAAPCTPECTFTRALHGRCGRAL